jgi:hypothetical protein
MLAEHHHRGAAERGVGWLEFSSKKRAESSESRISRRYLRGM